MSVPLNDRSIKKILKKENGKNSNHVLKKKINLHIFYFYKCTYKKGSNPELMIVPVKRRRNVIVEKFNFEWKKLPMKLYHSRNSPEKF